MTLGNEASVVAAPRTSPGKLASAESLFSCDLVRKPVSGRWKDFDSARRAVREIGSLRGDICPSALPFEFAETLRLQTVRCFAEASGVAVVVRAGWNCWPL